MYICLSYIISYKRLNFHENSTLSFLHITYCIKQKGIHLGFLLYSGFYKSCRRWELNTPLFKKSSKRKAFRTSCIITCSITCSTSISFLCQFYILEKNILSHIPHYQMQTYSPHLSRKPAPFLYHRNIMQFQLYLF